MSLPLERVRPPGPAHQKLQRPPLRQSRSARQPAGDRLEISGYGRQLGGLLGTWSILAQLFGLKGPQGPGQIPDLAALREALVQAQRNLEENRVRTGILDTLKATALRGAERLVDERYGLVGDGSDIRVVLHDEMGGALASISYFYDQHGRMAQIHLNLSASQFKPDYGPNGTNDHVIENDRIIAHEITHAVMGRNMDLRFLPDWFMEGTAEYVAGGAERVALVLKRYSARQLVQRLNAPWEGDTTQYAASYLAVRYLDTVMGPNGGIRALMSELKAGTPLDEAIFRLTGGKFSGEAAFRRHFVGGAGEAFMGTVDLSGRDPGSIRPARGRDVVDDRGPRSSQPLQGFHVQWPAPAEWMRFDLRPPAPAGTWQQAAAAAYGRWMA